jgi:predicted transcriptional regulator
MITITIDDETLVARLLAAAAARGEDPNRYAVAAIAEAVESDADSYTTGYDPDALSPEEIAESREGIRRGLEAAEAGRVIPFDVWGEQKRQKYGLRDSVGAEGTGPK